MSDALLNKETEEATATLPNESIHSNVWDLLDSLSGTIEGPEDWSEQLDHYLYGTPKK